MVVCRTPTFQAINSPLVAKSALISFLLFTCLSGDCQNQSPEEKPHDFLAKFRARSLVHVRKLAKNVEDHDELLLLEVEETYDATRQLGKLTIQLEDGQRSELFARPAQNLYLETRYDSLGAMQSCQVHDKMPTGGHFGTLQYLLAVPLGEKLKESGFNGSLYSHLMGPAALVYLYRHDLRLQWPQDKPQVNATTNKLPASDGDNDLATRKITARRRLIVDPSNSVSFVYDNYNNRLRKDTTILAFMRSDFLLVDRSPLLSRLAASISLSNSQRLFTIDLLSLDQVDSFAWDPFYLPRFFECISPDTNSSRDINPADEKQDRVYNKQNAEYWFKRLPVASADFVSFSLYGAVLPPAGLQMAVSLGSGLIKMSDPMKFAIILDPKQELIYYLPREPVVVADDQLVADDFNGDCSILSASSLLSSTRDTSITDQWRLLLGETQSIVYLGQTKFMSQPQAHEFQLSYSSLEKLPVYSTLLLAQATGRWPNVTSTSSGLSIVSSLYIAPCADLYESDSSCPEPELLGFRVKMLAPDGSDKNLVEIWSQEVQITEFRWNLVEGGLLQQPFEAFDLRKCPLERQSFAIDAKWMQTFELDPNGSEQEVVRLDRHVGKRLENYLADSMGRCNLSLISLERRGYPGTRAATFHFELAEIPQASGSFDKMILVDSTGEPQFITSNSLATRALGQMVAGNLLNCLAWSSIQFPSASVKWTLYNRLTGDCFVLGPNVNGELSELTEDPLQRAENLFYIYKQQRQSAIDSQQPSGMKQFLAIHLGRVQSAIKNQVSESNGQATVSIGLNALTRDVRLEQLRVDRHAERGLKTDNSSLLVSRGFRFAQLDQEEASSWSDCYTRCQDEAQCGAFSHCSYPDSGHQFCQLQLTNTSSADSTTSEPLTRDAGCEIHAKNYLNSFEQQEEFAANSLDLTQGHRWHWAASIETASDCARVCSSMSPSDLCMRFLFCPWAATSSRSTCLVWLEDATQVEPSNLVAVGVELRLRVDGPLSAGSCSSFQRKPISLYRRQLILRQNQLPEKREDTENEEVESNWVLGDEKSEPMKATRLMRLSKEECAARCSQELECQSFDSCLVTSSVKIQAQNFVFRHLECHLLAGSIFDSGPQRMRLASTGPKNQISASHRSDGSLEATTNETVIVHREHFEQLQAQRRLTQKEAAILVQELAHSANSDRLGAGNSIAAGMSYAGSLFCAALFGLGLGVGANAFAASWAAARRRRHLQKP